MKHYSYPEGKKCTVWGLNYGDREEFENLIPQLRDENGDAAVPPSSSAVTASRLQGASL
jgi:hypothetical protein